MSEIGKQLIEGLTEFRDKLEMMTEIESLRETIEVMQDSDVMTQIVASKNEEINRQIEEVAAGAQP